MIPLDAATRGYISSNIVIGMATDGLIRFAVIPSLGDGGGGVSGRVQEDLYRWRLRDDKEIIDIVMAIVLSGRL